MRKEELHHTLMHPELLSDEQLLELREAVARFPFFGAAQIALTQAFKARGDMQFTDQLSQAAIYTGHRAALYHRLKGINGDKTPTVPLSPAPIEETQSLASKIIDDEAPIETVDIESSEPAANLEPIVEDKVQEIEQEKIETEINEENSSMKFSELDPLQAQILVNAVNTSIELEVQPLHDAEQQKESANSSLEPDDEQSYAAIIYRRAQRKHLLPSEQTSLGADAGAETESLERQLTPRSPAISLGIQRITAPDSKHQQRQLVDRFIHHEPQIARGKVGDYTTGNIAKESLEEDFSMVTETMAILFAKQGKLDKARKAFRKLMEQHPEKSVYFATQLKNLEHLKK
jgi:hypothetical protein